MNTYLVAASIVIGMLAIAHSYVGERFLIRPLLRRDDLPRLLGSVALARRTIRFAWHITSVLGLGFAALLVVLASRDEGVATLARIIAVTFAGCGLLSLVVARGRHPSWLIFFAAALLAWLGA